MQGTIEESIGSEIVKQIMACPSCYKELTGLEPRVHVSVAAISKTSKVHHGKEERRPWRNPRNNKVNRGGDRAQHPGQREPRPAPIVEVVNKLSIVKE